MSHEMVVQDVHPTLRHGEREGLGALLQGQLSDLTDLSLLGKQMHWTLHGARFRSLHLQLDELVDSWRAMGDEAAERAVALGAFPDGQVRTIAGASEIEPVEVGPLIDDFVLDALTERLGEVIARARERMERAAEYDPVTEDMLHAQVQALEEQHWMIRSQRVPR